MYPLKSKRPILNWPTHLPPAIPPMSDPLAQDIRDELVKAMETMAIAEDPSHYRPCVLVLAELLFVRRFIGAGTFMLVCDHSAYLAARTKRSAEAT